MSVLSLGAVLLLLHACSVVVADTSSLPTTDVLLALKSGAAQRYHYALEANILVASFLSATDADTDALIAMSFPHGRIIHYNANDHPPCPSGESRAIQLGEPPIRIDESCEVETVVSAVGSEISSSGVFDVVWIQVGSGISRETELRVVSFMTELLVSIVVPADGVVAIHGYPKAAAQDTHPSEVSSPILRYVLDVTTCMLATPPQGHREVASAWPLQFPQARVVSSQVADVAVNDEGLLMFRKLSLDHQ